MWQLATLRERPPRVDAGSGSSSPEPASTYPECHTSRVGFPVCIMGGQHSPRLPRSPTMIDQQQQTDHAEHAAVRAEQAAENASERAHADLVAETVRHLRTVSHNAHADAQESVASLAAEVNLRLAPNAHRYELLARRQHVALLAASTAVAVEETSSYDLSAVLQGVTLAYRATHLDRTRPAGDTLNRVLLAAIEQVENAVEEVAQHAADAETQRAIAEREQYEAEQERLVEQYETRYEL